MAIKTLQTRRVRMLKFLADAGAKIPLLHLLRNNSNLFYIRDIAKDYLRLKKNCGFLKNDFGDMSGKKVLIVSLSHFLYQIKTEAMLAKALQSEGCRVNVLTWKHFFWPRKYFNLFGIDEFVYFEDYLSKFNNCEYREDLNDFLSRKMSFQEVKKWKYKKCRIGQQVLSMIVRRVHGTPSLLEPKICGLFAYYLKRQLRSINAAAVMLEEARPDIVIFNEANDSIYGGIFDLAFDRGSDTIQFVQPLRDDALIFKRFTLESKGMHPNSLSKSTFDRIKEIDWTDDMEKALWREFSIRYGGKWFLSQRNQVGTVSKDRRQIIEQLGIDSSKKTAVVFSHVLWDANLFYGDDLFQDYEDWFIQTVIAACDNPGVNWIIKLHPSNVWKRNRDRVKGELREAVVIRERIGKLPGHVCLLYPDTDISTFSLFNVADYAVTVRGTVGMEIACFGKPVFTAGTGRYSGLGFTIDSESSKDYLDKLSKIGDFPLLNGEQTLLAKKHAYTVFNLRPWKMESFRAEFNYKKKGSHPLDHNLYPQISSVKEAAAARDFSKFSEWVLNSKDSDYLEDSN
jgi:hypothetical protein